MFNVRKDDKLLRSIFALVSCHSSLRGKKSQSDICGMHVWPYFFFHRFF